MGELSSDEIAVKNMKTFVTNAVTEQAKRDAILAQIDAKNLDQAFKSLGVSGTVQWEGNMERTKIETGLKHFNRGTT